MTPVGLASAPTADPVALAAAFCPAAGLAFAAVAAAWFASRARLHRADRIGAAALAVGFVGGYQLVVPGGGWHPERIVTWSPLIAVVGALIGPRLAARVAAEARVPLAARGFVLLAAAAATLAIGPVEVGALLLCALGAGLGVTFSERLSDTTGEAGLHRPDRRPGTWVLAALLVGLVPALGA